MHGLDLLGAPAEPRTLKRGSTGNDVVAASKALATAGFNVPVTKTFGPKMEAAVKAFQTARGLKADGIIGPETRLELAIPTGPSAAPAAAADSADSFVGPPEPAGLRPSTAAKAAGAAAAAKGCGATGGFEEWMNFLVVMLVVFTVALVAPAVYPLARRWLRVLGSKLLVLASTVASYPPLR